MQAVWRHVGAAGAAIVLAFGVGAHASAQPVARTDTGRVAGVVAGDVRVFKGIPYAAAPVGALRWRPPRPAPRWRSVRAAEAFGPACLQRRPITPPQPQSEDCLTLNVWAPTARTGPLPVMVWIHGGSFTSGSGSAPVLDGAALARRDVVVVTLNYRLGRFGFFAHPELSKEHPAEWKANYGLMDQIAALAWVKRNIAAFGGDPANVTIFGESSGAAAVNRLMVARPAFGLFHRAISQSGNGREYMPRLTQPNPDGLAAAEASGQAFAVAMGVPTADPAVLRAIPADRILSLGDRTAIEGGPVIDGRLLTQDVYEAFEQGREAKAPFIVGSTATELPIPPAAFEGAFNTLVRVDRADRIQIQRAYPSEASFKAQALSDLIFGEPARFLAAAHARNGHPSWLYRFSVLSSVMRPSLRGAPHASELPYVFGVLGAMRWPADSADSERSAELIGYWTGFAKRGAPAGAGLPDWPRYAAAEDLLLDFANDGPVVRRTPDAVQLDAIAATYRDRLNPESQGSLKSNY